MNAQLAQRIINFVDCLFSEQQGLEYGPTIAITKLPFMAKWESVKDSEHIKYYEEGLQMKIADYLEDLKMA